MTDPAIQFKPLKEKPAFAYGKFSVKLETISPPVTSEQNTISFWFKFPDIASQKNNYLVALVEAEGMTSLIINPKGEIPYALGIPPYWNPNDPVPYTQTATERKGLFVKFQNRNTIIWKQVFKTTPLTPDSWAHICLIRKKDRVIIYLKGEKEEVLLNDLGGVYIQGVFLNSKDQNGYIPEKFALDELLVDWSAEMSFDRYQEVSGDSLPWAALEKKENWLSIHAKDPFKVDTNIFDSVFIKLFTSSGYVQYPNFPTPEEAGFVFEGYEWRKVDFNGAFFRTEGTGAKPFNGGEQGDAIRNITGFLGSVSMWGANGAFSLGTELRYLGANGEAICQDTWFDASRVVPTAEENRPRNLTVVIWRLFKK